MTAKVWDAKTGQLLLTLIGHTDQVAGIVYSPDGSLLIIGVLQGNVDVWDLRTGEKIKTLNVSKLADFWSQTLGPDGSMLAVATTNDLQRWDVATGRVISTWPAPEANIMAFTPDGKFLLVGTCLGTVNVLRFLSLAVSTALGSATMAAVWRLVRNRAHLNCVIGTLMKSCSNCRLATPLRISECNSVPMIRV